MKNAEKIIIPLTIGAAVISIWAAFRKQPITNVQSAGGVQLPPIPPLQDTHFGLPFSDYSSPATAAGGGHTSHGGYIYNAAGNPLSVSPSPNYNPNASSNPFAYLQFNLPPWDVPGKVAAAQMIGNGPAKSAGGCGGGCGGCSKGADCSQTITPRFPDGHGDCLAVKPKFTNLSTTLANTQYMAASYDLIGMYNGVPGDDRVASAGIIYAATGGY